MLEGYLNVQDTWCWWAEPRKAMKLDTKICVWREGKEEEEEGNHRLSPCETPDRKQDWREVTDDAGLGSAGQTAHHALCKEAATELLLEININKKMEA